MHADIDWLTPSLAFGACVPDDAIEAVAREFRFRQVIDLRAEIKVDPFVWIRHGVRFLSLPTPDHRPLDAESLQRGVECVAAALEANERVLVHCEFGIGRSALLACCVLVSLGRSPCEALAMAKRARPIVSPHPEQLHALLAFAHACRRAHGPPSTESWEDLAAIAYGQEHFAR